MANNRRYRNRKPTKVDNYDPPFKEEILSQGIEILNLRENTQNLLIGARVTTIIDVVKKEDKDFYKISTFNKKNLFELKNALKANKLFLKPTPEMENTEKSEDKKTGVDNNRQQNGRQPNGRTQESRQNTHPNNNNKRERRDNQVPYVETTRIVRPEKPVTEVVKEAPDIYVKVNKNGKWGFKNREGKQVIEPLYDEVFNFKEELCCVQKDDLFGFVNRNGEEVVPIIYSCASSFSEGLACVFKGDKCGYVNNNNEVIIDFKFDAGTSVINGECRVKKEGKWGELHIKPPAGNEAEAVLPFELGIDNIRWII
jgi:hypothetical protein